MSRNHNRGIQKCFQARRQTRRTNVKGLKSVLAYFKPPEDCDNSSSSSASGTQDTEIILSQCNISTTLEQFGFKTSKATTEPKSKKSSKRKPPHEVPILFKRTSEIQQSLINTKIKAITEKNKMNLEKTVKESDLTPSSNLLKKFHYKTPSIWNINTLPLMILNQKGIFYTKALNLEPSKSHCGCLLKEWHKIPGRDISPPPRHRPQTKLNDLIKSNSDQLTSTYQSSFNTSSSTITLPRTHSNWDETNSVKESSVKSSEDVISMKRVLSFSKSTSIKDSSLGETDFIGRESELSVIEDSQPSRSGHVLPLESNNDLNIRSITPDLFDSEDELPVRQSSDEQSQSVLSFSFKENRKQSKTPSKKQKTPEPELYYSSDEDIICATNSEIILSKNDNVAKPFTEISGIYLSETRRAILNFSGESTDFNDSSRTPSPGSLFMSTSHEAVDLPLSQANLKQQARKRQAYSLINFEHFNVETKRRRQSD